MEYVAAELADELGAKVAYRGDGAYDMGELLSAVIGRQAKLLKRAAKAAKSWEDADAIEKVEKLLRARAMILRDKEAEQWIINKAVHYNGWVDLSKKDFAPVVEAFKKLLHQFRCERPNCNSWLSLDHKKNPTGLSGACCKFHINLREK